MDDPVEQGDPKPDAAPAIAAREAPPRLLADRYLLEERIADGGMASVWRGHDEVLARTVAIKVLHEHLAADPSFRERFRREAIVAAKLTHPHVVSLYDTGSEEDRVYLVMEYVDGVTLKDVIADLGQLEVEQATGIALRVAGALDYAHNQGLVHRDIKPANILIGSDGTVKVTDFGIAKVLEQASDLTKTGMVLGTAAYVAPEQILSKPLDGRADQYALGCVLYEALTGRQPFSGDSSIATAAARLEQDPLPPRAVRADIPRALDAVVMRTLARDPDRRFPSAGALAEALVPFANTEPDQTASLLRADEPTEAVWTEPETDLVTPTTRSFLRSEGRWLAPVLALLLLTAALIGVGLATGVLAPDGEGFLPIRIASDEERAARNAEEAPRETELIGVTAITAFDPQGTDGVENDADLPNLLDGDVATTWRTDLYNTAAFGNLKEGVGFWVDLGAPYRVSLVALRTTTPGIAYEVRAADQPADTPEGWEVVGSVSDAPELGEVRTAEPRPARYLLVWITGDLQPRSGRFTAELTDIAVYGEPD